MSVYNEIKNQKDVNLFDAITNCLHDGYIISVGYQNDGIDAKDGYTEFDYRKTSLVIRVLVTSLSEKPIVELCFKDIIDWQIVSGNNEILDSAFSFEKNGCITWIDSYCTDKEIMRDSTFVVAKHIFWRL